MKESGIILDNSGNHNFQTSPAMRKFIWLLIIIGVLNVIFWLWGGDIISTFENRFAFLSRDWDAVYMADGSVLIGRLQTVTSGLVKLNDVYVIQPKSQATAATSSTFNVAGSLANGGSLIKWGANQPLKSAGNLNINRPSVIFWESLAKDSEISKQLDASLQK